MKRPYAPFVIAALFSSIAVAPCGAEEIWALAAGNLLLNFDSATPNLCASRAITGLDVREIVMAIDFRPAAPYGRLYVLTDLGQLYVIANPASGAATSVGAGGLSVASGVSYGADFNPVVDRIRVISDTDQNIRVNPDLGTQIIDVPLSYAPGDANFGANPNATAAAYTNNFPGPAVTTLYAIESGLDVLAVMTNPNGGTLATVGGLGVNASATGGFDISGTTRTAYAAFNVNLPPVTPVLYTINLATGLASAVGAIGCGGTLQGLSVLKTDLTAVPSVSLASGSMVAIPSIAWASTRFEFGRPLAGRGMLRICDVQGRVIRSLEVGPGARGMEWDCADDGGRRVHAGLYFARLVARDLVATARVAVLRP